MDFKNLKNLNKLKDLIKLNKMNKIISILLLVILAVWAIVVLILSETNKKYVQSSNMVYSLSEKIRTHYNNRPDYWGLYNKSAIDNGLINKSMINNNEIVNNLSKPILIGSGISGSVIMPGTKNFDIVYKDLTKTECINILSEKTTETQSLALLSISLINKANNITYGWGNDNKLPIQSSSAKKHCEENSIILWHFE